MPTHLHKHKNNNRKLRLRVQKKVEPTDAAHRQQSQPRQLAKGLPTAGKKLTIHYLQQGVSLGACCLQLLLKPLTRRINTVDFVEVTKEVKEKAEKQPERATVVIEYLEKRIENGYSDRQVLPGTQVQPSVLMPLKQNKLH